MALITKPQSPSLYPTGAWAYLDNLDLSNGSAPSKEAKCKLKVGIVGAGIGGLSAAIALAADGHSVVVLEGASALAEIGAGIQIPPNSTRILRSWGVEYALREKSVRPRSLYWKRWQDGRVISHTRYEPFFEKWFGAPYYVVHRAHLHEVLYERALDLGVEVRLKQTVVRYSLDRPMLELSEGNFQADLIVAADGIKSLARRTINGTHSSKLRSYGFAAYRAAIPMSAIKADAELAAKIDFDSLNLWVGDNAHVMSYGIVGGEVWNVVANVPESREVADWDDEENVSVAALQSHFQDWDPVLVNLLEKAVKTKKWPVQDIECAEQWLSPSKTTVLLGDAAHAMLPFMSIGAAMAVEDAAALAQALRLIEDPSQAKFALDVYEQVRKLRTSTMHSASYRHVYTVHLPDGPEQRARDAAMEDEVKGLHFIRSPNQWSDPSTQQWAYSYDVEAPILEAWNERFINRD